MTGIANLGIEAPVHLLDSFVDRYGQCVSWSVREMGLDETDLLEEVSTQLTLQDVAWYEYGNGKLEVKLAGIGAQFDC